MNIIRKIGWFLKLEKKRYIVGILALSLVSVFNLIPPRVIGNVVDNIASGQLTNKLTLDATDPISGETDYKKCAVRVEKA